MKKLFIMLSLALSSVCTFAQENLSWEGQIGINVAKLTSGIYDSRVGYHVGARAKMELPTLADGVYANAGAFLTLKGASVDWGELGSSKINMNYLEIPIHMGYQYAINEDFSVYGEFGPYFAIGLFGKTKNKDYDYSGDDYFNDYYFDDPYYDEETTSSSYNTFDDFKRFDFGLGFRFGAEFKQKYTLSIGYDFGLIDGWHEPDTTDEDIDLTGSIKNRNLTIGIGYKF